MELLGTDVKDRAVGTSAKLWIKSILLRMTKQEVTETTLSRLDGLYLFLTDETPTTDMDEAEQAAYESVKGTIAELRELIRATETLR